ncbi:uncharacterized protein LOC132453028 [Gadus macrocephalus]|uniref:uncharacterized protein LOC132453028 n=1 Tax=Gadus macrocephalus TaxID=80720 RepID=UPI0028CB17C2|nr:uncharacterized protein LOC132453028 [Gadus macrocephalus]
MLTRHQTVAYIAAAVQVPAHLEAEAWDLICPESMLVPLREMAEVEEMTLLTVQGWVKELGAFHPQTAAGGPPVPRRAVVLKDGDTEVELVLWREANLTQLEVGLLIRGTHLRAKRSNWGLSLHSTGHTSVEVINGDKEVQVMGYRILPDGDMEVLDPSDNEHVIPQAMWDAVIGKTVPAIRFHLLFTLFTFERAKLLQINLREEYPNNIQLSGAH